jgi:lysozyme
MKTSQRGIDLIKQFEGLELMAYHCSAGVPTIGYGHTRGVSLGDSCTEAQAEAMLVKDLEDTERQVIFYTKSLLTQNQFDALVSWTYNLGAGNLAASTMLKCINASKWDEVPDQMKRWDKCNGQPLTGLTRRRKAEAELFEER